MSPTVNTFVAGTQTVVEVSAPAAGVLDRLWRQRWAAAGRAAQAAWCSAGPANCSIRVDSDRSFTRAAPRRCGA